MAGGAGGDNGNGAGAAAQAVPPAAAASFNFFEGSIAPFNGEDKTYASTKWAQDVEDNAEVFGWTPQQKLIIARRSLCGTAALWLKSEKVFKTYDELKTALLKEFPESLNVKEMHELMAARKKTKGESYTQYMLIMKELGRRAKFPDYVAIQYIIDGIEDLQTNKVILYGVTNYSVLKEKLAIYEKMKSDMNTKRETSARKNPESSRRCYNCGDRSHVSAHCQKGLKCFKCNRYGHIGNHCTWVGQGGGGAAGEVKFERNASTNPGNPSVKQPMSTANHAATGSASVRAIGGRSAAPSMKQRSAMFGTTSAMTRASATRADDGGEVSMEESDVSGFEVMQIQQNKECTQSAGKPTKLLL